MRAADSKLFATEADALLPADPRVSVAPLRIASWRCAKLPKTLHELLKLLCIHCFNSVATCQQQEKTQSLSEALAHDLFKLFLHRLVSPHLFFL